ncbi:MAG: serine/threonine-protein kinase, partial [Pirellulaceae bacterium]
MQAEVESLLLSDEVAATGFLASPIHQGGNDGDFYDSLEDVLPTWIGPYRVVRKLGEGGMGVVYEAKQDHPKRSVAIKLIRPTVNSASILRRFAYEANILGQLHHPGIAHIYEANVAVVNGVRQPYFAMELIRGVPLIAHARAKSLDVRRRMELLARVCDAVQHAHQNGVIHRDLKPANILVQEEPDSPSLLRVAGRGGPDSSAGYRITWSVGQPRILDFGVARIT